MEAVAAAPTSAASAADSSTEARFPDSAIPSLRALSPGSRASIRVRSPNRARPWRLTASKPERMSENLQPKTHGLVFNKLRLNRGLKLL